MEMEVVVLAPRCQGSDLTGDQANDDHVIIKLDDGVGLWQCCCLDLFDLYAN